jgi:hypothetical protein
MQLKGILDKLLGLLIPKDADTLVNNVEHIVELLRYILKNEKGKRDRNEMRDAEEGREE